MGIDSDAEKDLSLSEDDAENVVGGHMTTKKKASSAAKHGTHGAAVTSFTVTGGALSGDPGVDPGMSQAEQESDPDC